MKHRTDKEKELADASRLLRAWRRWHREEREEALASPHGTVLHELFHMFANLKHIQPMQLIGYVQSIDWDSIDYNTRLTVIHELNNAITRFREKRGLEPIDDALPGEPDTPFRMIKAIVLAPSPHARAPTAAQCGLNKPTSQQ